MPKRASVRNNFTSGVLDPLVYARNDLEQYPAGLKTGTNVMLLPHGGFTRRPGLRFCRQLTGLGSPEYHGRLSRFRVRRETQYVLHWRDSRVDVYQGTTTAGFSDTSRITRIRTPYPNAYVPDLYLSPKAQTADTQVICHPSVPPYRLLRATLATTPVRTFSGLTRVRIYHPDHKLIDGDEIGLSGLATVGGVSAANLNTFFAVDVIEGDSGASDLATTASSTTLTITLPSGHDFVAGDRIKLTGYVAVGGVPAAQINRTHTVIASPAPDATHVSVTLPLQATANATGGGAGHWKAASFYEVTVASAASSSTTGGGTAGKSWVLHSLAVNANRTAALKNLPQFDFEDGSSPDPKPERQRLSFDLFANGDSYKLDISVPGSRFAAGDGRPGTSGTSFAGGISGQTPFIDWTTGDIEENGRRIEDEITNIIRNSPLTVTVTYDEDVSAGNGGSDPDHHEFVVEFAPNVAVSLIDVFKIRGDGTIEIDRDVAGGSTEEDVISTTRGWPGGCIFYDRRLWFFRISSRPSTVLASKIEDFFNFDIGTATESDAIDATGEFDPILHMIGERGLFLLTSGSEVEVGGGENETVTPGNIRLKPASRYGTTDVIPVSVGGRPIYIDRTGRTVRQLGFSDVSASSESKDISVLSQFLIDTPVAMDVWRNTYGDYVAVVMDDGSAAVLNISVDQGVAGWTTWTTSGDFKDVCESGDVLFAIVSRTVSATTVYFLEAFDLDFHTDAGVLGAGSDQSTWTGHDHIEGRTVQVRLSASELFSGAQTMAETTVVSGDIVSMNGDVPVTGSVCEVGLAIPTPTAEPMPPQTDLFTSLVRAEVDRFESKEVYVDGYRLPDYLPGETADGAVNSGIVPIQVIGWGERQTIAITAPNPQPMTIRSVAMEVAA